MKQNDWTDHLRERLSDYEAQVPDDLWAGIKAKMAAGATPMATPEAAPVVPLWRKWAAAAAVVLLIGAATLVLWPKDEDMAEPLAARMDKEPDVPTSKNAAATDAAATPETIAAIAKNAVKSVIANHVEEPAIAKDETEPAIAKNDAELAIAKNAEETAIAKNDTEAIPQAKESAAATDNSLTSHHSPLTSKTSPLRSASPLGSSKTSHHSPLTPRLSLYAQNGFGNEGGTNGVLMSSQMLSHYVSLTDDGRHFSSPVYLAGYEERKNHRLPLSIGLTVSYPLSSWLSLTTGVVYTRMTSEFLQITPSYQQAKQQTLHYVGIPLALRYRLISVGRLHIYAAGGTQADWNVQARLTTNGQSIDIDKDHVQWSANGSLGMEYSLLPALSLYAEPRISHYFDNGGTISNYYSDHPTSFSLQVGLSVSLPNLVR